MLTFYGWQTPRKSVNRIKWFHARRVFFSFSYEWWFDEGLALARQSEHPDARLFVSLFPNGAPRELEDICAVFLAHADDPRCLCWAARCRLGNWPKRMREAAERGYAWAQYLQGVFEGNNGWWEKAMAQGEPEAITAIARSLGHCERGKVRARKLTREAAVLGDPEAQERMGTMYCGDGSLDQLVWWRRSAWQQRTPTCRARALLESCVEHFLHNHEWELVGAGRKVFELGNAFSFIERHQIGYCYDRRYAEAVTQARKWYEHWCDKAKRAILCWIWVARQMGFPKDMRLAIADVIWNERAVWSE